MLRSAAIVVALIAGVAAERPALVARAFQASVHAAESPAAEPFQRGLTALHNFEYEQANDAFHRARTLDHEYVPAYWGEALTYHQLLWRNEDVAAGRAVLTALAPTAAARSAKARTARDRALLAAVEELFGAGDVDARRERFAASLAQAHAALPDDSDVTTLYALALLGNASRGLIGAGDAERNRSHAALAGSAVQQQIAALLQQVLKAHPDHPGALHYLIHDYDDPEHAPLALDAARRYAAVANGASHALHMPAHVFLQLGAWKDAARSDKAAYDASVRWTEERGLPAAVRNFHALSWLEYELLQLGRRRDAFEAMQVVERVVNPSGRPMQEGAGGHDPLLADRSSMRARYVVETRDWAMLGNGRTFGNVDELFALGLSAVHTGQMETATLARQTLDARSRAPEEGDLRPSIAIMAQELSGAIALARGDRDSAIAQLSAAARAELALPAPFGLPSPIKPAPEMLGEALLEAGRPAEAAQSFENALRRNANRSLSLAGLARAEAALGRHDSAKAHYRTLLANYEGADESLPEVAEAKAAIEGSGRRAMTMTAIVTAAAVVAAGFGFFWSRRRRAAAKTATQRLVKSNNRRAPRTR